MCPHAAYYYMYEDRSGNGEVLVGRDVPPQVLELNHAIALTNATKQVPELNDVTALTKATKHVLPQGRSARTKPCHSAS